METQPILPRSEIFVTLKSAENEYQFKKVYKTNRTSQLIVMNFGDFVSGKFRKPSMLSALEERRDLQGTHFKAGLVINFVESMQNYRNYR